MKIAAIDLFCGCGGLTHGLIQGGIDVVAGVDIEESCRYPYEVNNAGAKFLKRDITQLDPEELDSLYPAGSVRVLAGCVPCQPFSTANPKAGDPNDPRRNLMLEVLRLIYAIKPEVYIMENVPTVKRSEVFKKFVFDLREMGYHVHYSVENAVDYSVPQSRRRCILIACTHKEVMMNPLRRTQPLTVRDAISHLPPIAAGEQHPSDRIHKAAGLREVMLARIRASRPGGTWRDWPEELLSERFRKNLKIGFSDVYGRMTWDDPAPTIMTQFYGFSHGRFGHPEQDRAISLREGAILQGFPEWYEFVPPDQPVHLKPVARMIGNAVPPPVGKAIAEVIKCN